MAVKRKNYLKHDTEYTVSYRDMRGVDFSGSGACISPNRFSYLENMYRDYDGEGAGVTESVPGFRRILQTSGYCHGIYSYTSASATEYIVVHSGGYVYQFESAKRDMISKIKPVGTVANRKSHAFSAGGKLYLFDGNSIYILDDDGFHEIGDFGYEAYTPTTFIDGVAYEQRNLLSPYFIEKFFIDAAEKYARSTLGLKYTVISDADATVAVSGFENITDDINIVIPTYVTLGNKRYTVEEIGEGAFASNVDIESLWISEGVKRIHASAFMGCTYLSHVVTPTSIEHIDAGAFSDCHYLEYVYIGGGILSINKTAFNDCPNLADIKYELTETEFEAVDTELPAELFSFEAVDKSVNIEIPLSTKCLAINDVTIDGESIDFMVKYGDDCETVTAACLYFDNKNEIEGKKIEVYGILFDSTFGEYEGFTEALVNTDINAIDAIIGTTVSESFDGRVFVAGNPLLPNTVFYCARDGRGACNPLYFGAMDYFNDGVGSFPVTSLLAAADALAVFKSADDGCGSIYYHTPKETGIDLVPKIYPVSYIHSGIGCKGASLSFFDDPVFVSSQGISALDRVDISMKRSIVTRSHSVNPKLLGEDLSSARLAIWCGYLAVLVYGQIFLADSRATYIHETGGREYEWYYLNGIGTYQSDKPVYRYSSTSLNWLHVHPEPDTVCDREDYVIYTTTQDGHDYYFALTPEKKRYQVYKTEEKTGGYFDGAVEILGVGDLLFFGTGNGDICVFNNDKRGIAPTFLDQMEDFDDEEYFERMRRRIHPSFYSFAGHAPRYALKTVLDNCGIPHLTKSTVKHSLTIKCKSYSPNSPICEVGTDRNGYREVTSFPGGELDFAELDFSTLSMLTQNTFTVPIAEKEKGWIEKQLSLWSDKFNSPFGVYSLTYRFTVKGRIKKQ